MYPSAGNGCRTIVVPAKTRQCNFLLVKRNVFDALISRKVTYQYQKTGIRWKDHIKVVIAFENQKK